MAEKDCDRELRRLIKHFGITFKGVGADATGLPEEHAETFGIIRAIRNQRFEEYGVNITLANDQPWKEQTKRRVTWLASRAASLITQQRNEAGWRFSLENDVFHRFRIEVAW